VLLHFLSFKTSTEMTHKITSKAITALILGMGLLVSLFYSACSRDIKSDVSETTPQMPNTTEDKSEEAFAIDQAKQIGQTVYTHLRFNFLKNKAEDYINPAIRDEVMKAYRAGEERMKNLTVEQRIEKNLTEKKISTKQADYFKLLLQKTKELDNARSFQEIETVLNAYNKALLDDKSMPTAEKRMLLNTSEVILRTTDYLVNIVNQPQNRNTLQMRDASCIAGKKISCYGSILVSYVQIGAGIAGGAVYYAAVGIAGFIVGIVNIFTSSACDCSSYGNSCYTLLGITVLRGADLGCEGNNVRFCAWGDGPSPTSFEWSLAQINEAGEVITGTTLPLPNTPDRCASFTPNTDLDKKFRLTVTVGYSPNMCNEQPTTKNFDFTWREVVGDPGTIVIDGGNNTGYGEADATVGTSPTYFASGSFLTNPKNTFTWQPSLSIGSFTFGQVTSGGGSNIPVSSSNGIFAITINWTGINCGPGAFGMTSGYYFPCQRSSVSGFSSNSCSNIQKWGTLSVAVRQQ
jgi:hypothetical protein